MCILTLIIIPPAQVDVRRKPIAGVDLGMIDASCLSSAILVALELPCPPQIQHFPPLHPGIRPHILLPPREHK